MVYTICPLAIPKPVSEEYITQYTRIRLAALKANPEAFGSTFARGSESAFSRLQWRARVDNPAQTIYSATTAPSSTIPDASLGDSTGSCHDDDDDQESKWVEDRDAEIYMIIEMWVNL